MRATRSVREILLTAAPIALAVFVFAVSFGVLAITARIPGWAAVLMSALVFAGSAQFAALGVLTAGGGIVTAMLTGGHEHPERGKLRGAALGVLTAGGGIVTAMLTGGLLNLRYIATGIAVARSLPGGPLQRALLGQLVVDESYAMAAGAGEPGRPDRRTLLVTGALLHAVWVLGTLVGTLLGPVLGDPRRLGLDAAFPALFTALLWPMLSARHAVRCAIGGALVALALAPFTPPGVPLAGAAVVGLWLAR